jgi:hypothetical protein
MASTYSLKRSGHNRKIVLKLYYFYFEIIFLLPIEALMWGLPQLGSSALGRIKELNTS